MASSYALPPASAIHNPHAHGHGHGHSHFHSHSHSHTPSRLSYTPKSIKQTPSNGSLHSHSYSDSQLDHIQEHTYDHGHGHDREASPYPPSPYNGTVRGSSPDPFIEQKYEPAPIAAYPPGQTFKLQTSKHDMKVSYDIHDHHDHDHHDHDHDHDHDHSHHDHKHNHSHGNSHAKVATAGPRSRFTKFVLPYALQFPLLHTILAEKDSRRIFYFMSLNFAFMIVQATYGYMTDSLGLLSDSVHMFFDCLGLAVGLFAAVASKWPASERFPYGFGKIETLSGFGNAVFLMLISIEITTEAVERLSEGRETKRLTELFIVSLLGLVVNMVGMICFGHAGHDHGGHDHGHSHSHAHDKGHTHDHGCDHSHDNHTHSLAENSTHGSHAGHSHAHSHSNENMLGIYLHILADTMGSAAVVVSTILIHFTGWNGWDPLASCCIAVLIFASSIPLGKSSAKKLILTIPDNTEYSLRDTLGGVGELRGVASYSVPRFWLSDSSSNEPVLGAIHITATRGSDLNDVKDRTRAFLLERGMDVVVQVEKNGDTGCWCNNNSIRSPSGSRY